MTITIDEVRATAALARLALSDEDAARLVLEMDVILGYMDGLAAVDVTDVPPMTHAVLADLSLRDDELQGQLDVEAALRGAPRRSGGFFEVPRVIAHDKDG